MRLYAVFCVEKRHENKIVGLASAASICNYTCTYTYHSYYNLIQKLGSLINQIIVNRKRITKLTFYCKKKIMQRVSIKKEKIFFFCLLFRINWDEKKNFFDFKMKIFQPTNHNERPVDTPTYTAAVSQTLWWFYKVGIVPLYNPFLNNAYTRV